MIGWFPGRPAAPRGLIYLVVGGTAVALCTLAAALSFGGVLRSTVPWLDGSGALTRGGLPLVELVTNVAGAVTVGLLMVGAVLLPTSKGELPPLARRCLRAAAMVSAVWAVATLAAVVLSVSYLLGEPVSAVSPADLLSFVTDLSQGRALMAVAVLAVLISVLAPRSGTAGRAGIMLVVALGALLPPVLTGHSASSDDHTLAVFSLAVHIVAAVLWVGGLVVLTALAFPARELLPAIVPRYSKLAALCLVSVAASGAVNAWLRLGDLGAIFGSRYGLLLVAKTLLLGVLGLLGWWHRRASIPGLKDGRRARTFIRLASVEVVVMVAAMALATALSRAEPPAADTGPITPAGILLGFEPPGPPGLNAYAFNWWINPLFLSLILIGAALYTAGVIRLRRAGVHWPAARALAWFAGLAIVLLTTCGGLARYSMLLFSAHVAQHLILTLIAPIPLLLAAPVTLALRTLDPEPAATGRTIREILTAALGSSALRRLSHPLTALTLLVLSLYGFYASPLFEASMRNHVLHSVTMLGFLAIGLLYLRPLNPALLLAAVPFHLAFGLAFTQAGAVMASDWYAALGRSWGPSTLHDQQTAGLVILTLTALAALLKGVVIRRVTR